MQKYSESAKLKYHHIYIGAPVPKKRWGEPTYDGYADVVTREGQQLYREAIKKLKPRVMLFWMHANFPTALLEFTKNVSPHTKICHWYSNHRYQMPKGVDRVKEFVDVLVFNNKEPKQFNMYKKNTTIPILGTLYDGFNPNEIDYSDDTTDCDCFFGGGTYLKKSMSDAQFRFPGSKMRYDFVHAVAQKFNLVLHSGQKASGAWGGLNLEVRPEVFHPKYTYAMRKAKVTINLNHFPDFYKAYTRRTIRCMFARRPHVTLYIPGMEEDGFINGQNIFWFKSIEEGVDQIDRLLKDEKLRKSMGEKLYDLACRNHTFEVRLREFEELLTNSGVI